MNTFKHHTFTPLYRNEAGWFTVPDVEALANAYWTLYPAERGNSDLSPFEHWLARYNSFCRSRKRSHRHRKLVRQSHSRALSRAL